MTELSVSVVKGADAPIVRLSGEADVTTAQALAEALGAAVAGKPPLLVVDVSALDFIDSAALQVIAKANRTLRADGRRLALVGPTMAVARVLQLSGLDQIMAVYATAAEAAEQPESRLAPLGPVPHRRRRSSFRVPPAATSRGNVTGIATVVPPTRPATSPAPASPSPAASRSSRPAGRRAR